MAEHSYIIEISTNEPVLDHELDELRQDVIDFLSPGEGVTVSITQID